MNALDPRCHTPLGRALCARMQTERPPVCERTATEEFLRPPRGPHNVLECRILAGCAVLLATLVAADLLHRLPPGWRVPLALLAAPIVLQAVTLAGIFVARVVPAGRRPSATGHFLLGSLTAYALAFLVHAPWSRWPVVAWLVLCLLNLTCAACERLGRCAA